MTNETISPSEDGEVTHNEVPENDGFDQELDSQEESEKEEFDENHFAEGERLTFVRVRFPGNAKSFPFLVGERRFQYGQKVVAMSDRGMSVGYINSFPYEIGFHRNMLPIRSIHRLATQEDWDKQLFDFQREKEASQVCARLIEELKLDMNVTHVEFTQFGKKAVFYFTAPQRVDFRELVKKIVTELKLRVELRQISVRDRTAAIGAIGVCGLQTCCSSFLRNYGNVSIKMAKNQNLALIPSKINGVCGQLKCCLRYEDEVYLDKRRRLPKEGSMVELTNGDRGKVLKLHLLIEQFELLTDQGQKRRYAALMFDPSVHPPKDWKFPTQFDHIVNETNTVIGLTLEEQKVQESFMEGMNAFDEDEPDAIELEDEDDSDDESEKVEAAQPRENAPDRSSPPSKNRRRRNRSRRPRADGDKKS